MERAGSGEAGEEGGEEGGGGREGGILPTLYSCGSKHHVLPPLVFIMLLVDPPLEGSITSWGRDGERGRESRKRRRSKEYQGYHFIAQPPPQIHLYIWYI